MASAAAIPRFSASAARRHARRARLPSDPVGTRFPAQRRFAPALLLAATLPLSTAFPLSAQETARPGTVSLSGRVVDAETGDPLLAATVRILGLARIAITDEDGRFAIEDVPPGIRPIGIEWDGLSSPPRRVRVDGDTEIRIALLVPAPAARAARPTYDLPPLGVEIRRGERPGKLREFFRRMETGHGHFITGDEIRDRAPLRTSDLLRTVPGVRLTRADFDRARSRVTRHRGCSVDMFLDGTPAPGLALDDIPPGDIAGIEIYRGASEVPIAFRRRATCAAILIWTHDPGRP